MSRRTKYTAEQKYEILKAYENGSNTMKEILTKYNISADAFYKWKYNYSKYGMGRLSELKTYKRYSEELKQLAVNEYLSGQISQREIVKKYEISTRTVLKGWVNKYNCHRETKALPKGMSPSMTKGRVTSWKERIEIVLCCIAQCKDYQQVAEVYNVSYQQVYQWVKKYESGGENKLKDRRGKKKFEQELEGKRY